MEKSGHPIKPEFYVNQTAIQKEPSVAQSDTSGYSHLAGDVDRWIHGSGTNVGSNGTNVASNGANVVGNGAYVANNGANVASNVANVAKNAANIANNAANTTLTSIGVQSSRYQYVQRPTTISGVHLHSSPCYAIAMMLLSIENRAGGRSLAAVFNCFKFLFTQLHQVWLECVADVRRAMQLTLPGDTLAASMFAVGVDVVLIVYAVGLLLLYTYQVTVAD